VPTFWAAPQVEVLRVTMRSDVHPHHLASKDPTWRAEVAILRRRLRARKLGVKFSIYRFRIESRLIGFALAVLKAFRKSVVFIRHLFLAP
jgi:hypothetical protein